MKYAIYPGWIISRTDGERHFIGYAELIRLYMLSARDCFNAQRPEAMKGRDSSQIKEIFPRYDGHYPLCKKQQEE